MIGLPPTTPTAGIVFTVGALFASVKVESPQSANKRGKQLDKNDTPHPEGVSHRMGETAGCDS